jgi:hypothetical protein
MRESAGFGPARIRAAGFALALALALAAGPARALDFELFDTGVTGSLRTQVAVGAAQRTEARDPALVGKLNLPGQEQFCEDKPPSGLPGAPAPGINCLTEAGNRAYLKLPGYPSANFDNGNLNYEKGDIVAAAFKLAPRLQLSWDRFGLDLTAVYFHDEANLGLTEYHPNNAADNNGFQPRHTPRSKVVEDKVGSDLRILDAYLSGAFALPGDRELSVKLGEQILSIGTSATMVFNSLNVVNPPDANLRFMPGSDLREVFRRIPMAVLGTSLTESVSVEAFYAFGWKPIIVPPDGSFYSVNDLFGAERPYVMLQFGKYREDPDNLMGELERTQGNVNQLSDAGRTLYFREPNEPKDGGEYGLTLGYFAENLNNTQFTVSYLNLHSRFPTVSFQAAEYGCSYNSTDAVSATVDCEGFRTTANNHSGREVLPLDTVRLFLDYPENVHALGAAFSTNLGEVAWTGELVYRPNQPFQVDPTDVGFAALQTIFPAQTIPIGLPMMGVVNIPGRRVAVPDYVETMWRGNKNVRAGQDIHGYERFQTLAWNTTFLFLRGASGNWLAADQLTTLIEVGALQVLDMPPLERLQLAAPGVFYHHSAGVDGRGKPNADQATAPSVVTDRLNPSYQAGNFATAWSWGYRVLGQLSYEEMFPGIKLAPQWSFFHDVGGKSPLPSGEFVAGRRQAMLGLATTWQNTWSAALRHNWFFGGGTDNLLSDRDNLQLSVSYDF